MWRATIVKLNPSSWESLCHPVRFKENQSDKTTFRAYDVKRKNKVRFSFDRWDGFVRYTPKKAFLDGAVCVARDHGTTAFAG